MERFSTVKEYYENLGKPNSKISSNTRISSTLREQKLEVLWSKAYQSKKHEVNYIEVPLIAPSRLITDYNFQGDGVKEKSDPYSRQSSIQRIVFFKDATGKLTERIVTYIPDKEYVKRRKNEMHLNTIKKMQSNFTGYMEYRTWDGEVTTVLRIQNGKVVRKYSVGRKSTSNKKMTKTLGQVCYERCQTQYQNECEFKGYNADGEPIISCKDVPVGETCNYYCYDDGNDPDPDPCADGSCEPEPDPCQYGNCNPDPDPNPCGYSYSKTGARIANNCLEIENNVDNPCLKKVTQSVIDKNINYDVSRSLKSLFGTTDNVNLYFNDDKLANGVAGDASIRYDRIRNGIRELGININLSETVLPGASKEYIVSTIVHEALHAYFRERNSLQTLDHDIMANHYIDWFKDIMDDFFPNIDSVDNNALAWGGLGETLAWSRKSSAEKTVLSQIDNSYKTFQKGTKPCP